MSADRLVFDLAQEIEGQPNVFIRKDWVNILDNQSQNYAGNQSVIDTSQLSNSNKWMNYREAYLLMPLLLTLTNPANATPSGILPAAAATSCDYAMGLKNWFGSMVHSLTLDLNGTTIIQQTPFCNMWNAFKLMTSLSWGDVITQGATIGFYPDDPLAWGFQAAAGPCGMGVCNNSISTLGGGASSVSVFNRYKAAVPTATGIQSSSGIGNVGHLKRVQYINYDSDGVIGSAAETYGSLLTAASVKTLWKSFVLTKQSTAAAAQGVFQIAVSATVYLKHLHSFFSMIPLVRGVFMKLTLNLNNTSVTFTPTVAATGGVNYPTAVTLGSVSNAVGGVCPLMITSPASIPTAYAAADAVQMTASVSVGARCLNTAQSTLAGVAYGSMAQSIYLYIPAYSFSPDFEAAYISSPIKEIVYSDIYQYQVQGVASGGTFNALLTNGIKDLKSVTVMPFFAPASAGLGGYPAYQSPFDPAGCGATSPLCLLTNFNVVISGQNAIYNTERYSFEHFNNQLAGCHSVNGGMTDGLTSSLIDVLGFEMEQCFYYTNVSRMLPVEESVPKSVQIQGQNLSSKAIDLWAFLEYGQKISLNILTGERVAM